MPTKQQVVKPWVLSTLKGSPHAHWSEVDRFESKPAAEAEAKRLRLSSVRIAFAYKPVEVAENETNNGG